MRHKTMVRINLFLVFFIAATFFYFVRSSINALVWNDSPQIAENLYDFYQPNSGNENTVVPICRDEGASGLRLGTPNLVKTIFKRAFSCFEFGGYRPLSTVISLLGVSVFSEATDKTKHKEYLGKLWILGVAFLFGLLALFFFIITKQFVQTNIAAYTVLVLFFFSPPVVAGAWVLFSGIQVIVLLFICLGLWFYYKAVETRPNNIFWIIGLFLILFFGPWVREFLGLIALLVLFLEFYKSRKLTLISIIAILCFFHAIFPTALVHLFIYDLPITPVFKLGSLATQLDSVTNVNSSIWNLVVHPKWAMARVFLVFLPPTLMLVTGIVLLLSLKRDVRALLIVTSVIVALAFSIVKPWLFLIIILSFCGLTLLIGFKNQESYKNNQISKILFLNVWFLLSFLPFLKVFSEHVHLAYALIPFTILVVYSIEYYWLNVSKFSIHPLRKGLFTALLLLTIFDQVLNVYGSYVTIKSLNDGISHMADWFKENTPLGTIVIANALHVEDIRLNSQNHISPYWSVGVGIPQERSLDKPDELSKFLNKHFNKNIILLLNIEQDFKHNKWNFHAHKYVTRKSVKVEPVGRIYSVTATFPFVDPLRNLIPRQMMLFLGPPDLENDIYFGHDRMHRVFLNEVNVAYSVYKVLDPLVSLNAYLFPNSTFLHPQLLKTYNGYNLYGFLDKLIAIPEGEQLDEKSINSENKALFGTSLNDLEVKIDKTISKN